MSGHFKELRAKYITFCLLVLVTSIRNGSYWIGQEPGTMGEAIIGRLSGFPAKAPEPGGT